jgi:hypothetical protein
VLMFIRFKDLIVILSFFEEWYVTWLLNI